MSPTDRSLLLVDNDTTINRLILFGLLVASPSLHYLCFDNTYDPLWMRVVCSLLCMGTLAASYGRATKLVKPLNYITAGAFLLLNNYLLLSANGFNHVYLFASITVFIALTLVCKKLWEFIALTALNAAAILGAYYTAPVLSISESVLVVLMLVFALIACVSFMVSAAYQQQFSKAVSNIIELNRSLLSNDEKLRNSRQQLHALISSVNETILEFDENRICINVWFGPNAPAYFKPEHFLNKTIIEAIGPERARPFQAVYDHVINHRRPYQVEFASVYGEDGWFLAKASPVLDANGNFTRRISVSVTDITARKKYEAALLESKESLQQAHQIAKIGNWWYDDVLKENYWADNLFNILEIDEMPEGLTKFQYYISMVHPDDAELVNRYFSNITTLAQTSIEHKIITPKGNLKYLRILRGDLTFDEQGNFKRVVGISQDITESRLAEKAVKVSRAELLEAQTIAKIGNWKWDSRQKVLSWSDEISSIYEIDGGETASKFGRLLLKYIHPDDKYIARHLFAHAGEGRSYEYRIITAKGNIKYISLITGKQMYREDGSLRKIIGTLQDITDRKQAEIDFKRTENKYRTVLETIKLAAVSLNAEGNVIFCNKYLANLLGYTQAEILGMNWMQHFVTAEHREILTGWFKDSIVRAHYVNPVICRDGELRTISWQNTVSFDENGKIKETTSIGEDITLQQRARQELISAKERAERSSHFKSEFLSVMSHEIRTPMNAVIGTTNLLLEEDPKPEQLEYLNTLKFSGENLLAIINDILDYNKIEAGKLQLARAPFDIYQLVQNVKQSFHSRALEKNLDIEINIDSNIPQMLTGDQVRLGQILINLVNNAVKFTHKGKVSILLEQTDAASTNSTIKFTIADTGIGIAAENLGVIFDPFIQAPHAASHNYGGTGLGLAITKRLIELYDSSIHVISDLGKGTRFSFNITFDTPEDAGSITTSEKSDAALPHDLYGMNVLVVDDNRMNLMIAAKFLKKWQANVDEALNGQIAVDMVNAKPYDLIIMDLQMPVMDGFEATAIIKRAHPQIPVIAFTADAMPETHSKAYAAGMSDYLTKPFAPEDLFEKVSRYRKNVITEGATEQY